MKFSIVLIFLAPHFLCAFQSILLSQSDSDTYNLKWSAIQNWLNSTRSVPAEKVKQLCTNRLIDLVVTMCRQQLAEYHPNDNSFNQPGAGNQEGLPKLRQFHPWNLTDVAATNKKFRNVLKNTLQSTDINECCVQACNVTMFLKYCPTHREPAGDKANQEMNSDRLILGTISAVQPHPNRHQSHQLVESLIRVKSGTASPIETQRNALINSYEIWKAKFTRPSAALEKMESVVEYSTRNPFFISTLSSTQITTPIYEPIESDSIDTVEYVSVQVIPRTRNYYHHHHRRRPQTTNPPSDNQSGPEPFVFPISTSDILFRP